jgi:endonuclease/exonuclease/phosphatase family metal-dependent hydrolase
LWGALLADLGQWYFRLSGGYSSKVNLASHFWAYISFGGALAGLLARGMPNILRSLPTAWLLISLALLFGGHVSPRETLPPPTGPLLRVLTLNIGSTSANRSRTISFLRKQEKLDVLFLQEVDNSAEGGDRKKLEAALGGRYPYSAWGRGQGREIAQFSLAIMSRHPLRNVRVVKLSADDDPEDFCHQRSALTANAEIGGRSVRLATVQLCPLAMPWQNGQGHPISVSVESVFNSLMRVRAYEYARRNQLAALRRMAGSGTGPLILAGDLNTTAHSLGYLQLSRGLKNAFGERGLGFGFTFSLGFLGERIDHIFYTPGIRAREAVVHDVKISDHRPLEALLEILPLKASSK